MITYLVGNKADLEEEREITPEMALEMKQSLGCDHYMETSPVTNMGITELFETLAKHLYLYN